MGGRKGEWIRGGGVCGARRLERQVTGGFGPVCVITAGRRPRLHNYREVSCESGFFLKINRLVIVKDLF